MNELIDRNNKYPKNNFMAWVTEWATNNNLK